MNLSSGPILLLTLAGLAGCGGGGSTGPTTATPASVVHGIAATGGPISGRVYVKDSAGRERFVDTTNGAFTIAVDGLSVPFMLKAQWTVGNQTQSIYSLATQAGTVNITPLTQLVVAAAAQSTALDSLYASSPAAFPGLAAGLPAATAAVSRSLAPLLATYGQSNADVMGGAFSPDHTGMDALLDDIDVASAGGNLTVSNKQTGALILQAPAANLTNAVVMPAWSAQDGVSAYHPDVAVAADGTALAVWAETIAGHSVIRARILDGSGRAAVTIGTTPNSDSDVPQVVFDGSGNAIVVWQQYVSPRATIWTARYAAGSGTWSTPQQISDLNPPADASTPVVTLDQAGHAIAAWTEGNGITNHYDIWAARFDSTRSLWGAPSIVSDGVNSAYLPHVAVNASGQGLFAWVQEQGTGSVSNAPVDVWGMAVSTTAAWNNAPARLNAIPGSSNRWLDVYTSLAVDTAGNGAALWVQNAGTGNSEVHAAMFTPAGGWQPSAVIATSPVSGYRFPVMAYDAAGNAVAAWREMLVAGGTIGSASRYVPGTGWGATHTFVDNTLGDVFDVRAAVDGAGDATLVWYQLKVGTSPSVYTTRYLAGTGWDVVNTVSSTTMDGFTSCPAPRVGANASGRTVTIWGYSDNTC